MAKEEITYVWYCRTVDCYPSVDDKKDVVYNVHWNLRGDSSKTDDKGNAYSSSIYGTQVISTSDLSEFTPFEDLDNKIITDWVINIMGDRVSDYKKSISDQIADQITPRSITLQVAE